MLGRVENIAGKGENAGYQHFLLFSQCFQTASILGLLKVGIVWLRVKAIFTFPRKILKAVFYLGAVFGKN